MAATLSRHIWELTSASNLDRQHRVLWWRLFHGSLMCGVYRAYIGKATAAQANCLFSSCIGPSQPQTISHLFVTCLVAAEVTIWLCRLWQVMTGYLPVVSVASLLAADTPADQLASDALQTWPRLADQRLAVLHSIWAASQIAQASRPAQPACLRARRNPGVISFVTTSFTSIINCLTPRSLGETARV